MAKKRANNLNHRRNHSPRAGHGLHTGNLAMPDLEPVRVLVAGEVILDRYLHGDVSRISPEAPIPVLRVTRREEKPGNAGFVMANLRALGAEVSAAGVVGGDRDGQLLRDIFGGLGIGMRALLTDAGRPTTVKARLLGSVQSAHRGTQQLLRVDEEDSLPLAAAIERELIARMKRELPRVHGVLISDINKGLLTPNLLRSIIEGARKRKIPVIVDPRVTDDFSIYRGATMVTPAQRPCEPASSREMAANCRSTPLTDVMRITCAHVFGSQTTGTSADATCPDLHSPYILSKNARFRTRPGSCSGSGRNAAPAGYVNRN